MQACSGGATWTSTKSPMSVRALSRVMRNGLIAAVITVTPLRASRCATNAMRAMLVSRSSREKPSPFERWVRTTSPSRISTLRPRVRSTGATASASVDLPAPDRPVNQMTTPSFFFDISQHLWMTVRAPASMRTGLLGLLGGGLAVRIDEDLRDLGPRVLGGRRVALGEKLAHPRPAQDQALLLVVRARLDRRDAPAAPAPEAVLEEQRLDGELAG